MTEDEELAEALFLAKKHSTPVLRGWSPGDEDHPLPGLAEYGDVPDEERARVLADKQNPNKVPYSEELYIEFPLYYAKGRRDRKYWTRRLQQLRAVNARIENFKYVLVTSDFKVFQTNSFWRLMWVVLRTKLFGVKDPLKPKQVQSKLPVLHYP